MIPLIDGWHAKKKKMSEQCFVVLSTQSDPNDSMGVCDIPQFRCFLEHDLGPIDMAMAFKQFSQANIGIGDSLDHYLVMSILGSLLGFG